MYVTNKTDGLKLPASFRPFQIQQRSPRQHKYTRSILQAHGPNYYFVYLKITRQFKIVDSTHIDPIQQFRLKYWTTIANILNSPYQHMESGIPKIMIIELWSNYTHSC